MTKQKVDIRPDPSSPVLTAEDSLSIDILQQLNSSINAKTASLAERAKNSFEVFGREIMHRNDKPFHRALRRMLQNEPRGVALLPRGYGKSTITAVEYPLWRLAKNRDVRLISATSAQRLGIEWLREIEWHMTFNEDYRSCFGNMVPDKRQLTWTDTEKIVLGRSAKATHTSLYVIGLGGSALGKRADVLIADDIFEPDEGIPNETTIQKVKEWFFKIFYPIMEPGGQCFVIGTRFHPNDLYGELVEKAKWPSIVQKALDSSERSTWPERFSTEELKSRRETMGTAIFNLQYQNSVDDFSGTLLKLDWLQVILPEHIPSDLIIYQGIDPAFGGTDYMVIFTIGVHEASKRVFILDVVRTRVSPLQGIEIIKQQAEVWHPNTIGIETNAAQILLKDYLAQDDTLHIVGIPSITNKISRFLRMSSIFEAGRVFMKGTSPTTPLLCFQPFISEWIGFPNTKHDDTLDALEKALAVAVFNSAPPSSAVKESNPEDETNERRLLIFGHQRMGQRIFPSVSFTRGYRSTEESEEEPDRGTKKVPAGADTKQENSEPAALAQGKL